MPTQEQINRQGLAYIAGLHQAVRDLWAKMCDEEGISADSKFVVFSENNKFKPFYDNALTQLWEAETQYKAGGYVGLRIGKGGVAR